MMLYDSNRGIEVQWLVCAGPCRQHRNASNATKPTREKGKRLEKKLWPFPTDNTRACGSLCVVFEHVTKARNIDYHRPRD